MQRPLSRGRLFYLMGASGAGKDSLIRRCRERLQGGGVIFAHRYITRPPELAGENHIYLSPAEFQQRRDAALFALDWDSHGLRYGIGWEIDLWLGCNFNVVVNGSRAHLDTARLRYPDLVPVAVSVAPAVLRERLLARGRETPAEVEARLARTADLELADCPGLLRIHNDGELETAADALIQLLTAPDMA